VRRREFIAAIGGAAAWPAVARGQPTSTPARIGFLSPNTLKSQQARANFEAFRARLRELGLGEGQNFIIDYKDNDDPRGLSVAAAELVQARPDVLVVTGPEGALQTVISAKPVVPIVMIAINYDPIARGYVASLARPGGNITGVVFQQLELAQKQVELLNQAFPDRTRLAILFDDQSADQFTAAERAAKSLKMQVQPLKLENPPYDFETAFRTASAETAQTALVLSTPFFAQQSSRIAELAIAHRLPTMFIFKFYVQVGGLMSYGADFPVMYQRAADYVAKILKGARPVDLPIEQTVKFELVVNLKTAKAIGVELPTSILLRADGVIE
jgi:putative tryptophan/tyrosine transport system substrate-binding protein